MTFTVAELAEVMDRDDFDYTDLWYILHYEENEVETSLGTVYCIETDKSYRAEYQFDTYMIVKVQGRYFKKTGYYASFDGQHWDGDLVEVERKVVMREEWVQI